ncbi:hypothetical protein EGI22_04405 [Lacihabitans sp. LS3-19]|uniref:tetratricopeptide repeat-containing sensor histidine kinase n=1 Tax=Lacihabitans sp. LS3-19 TaxID=2487335 RepID=UPI0020CD307A|nr:histidine kinase dimerization/phosphoacceptor domain -containing protein [Lacihabitans sp. LS3-19]MCP9767140.1 hypothetical protein [Lacihabitans sp. LS3-19]
MKGRGKTDATKIIITVLFLAFIVVFNVNGQANKYSKLKVELDKHVKFINSNPEIARDYIKNQKENAKSSEDLALIFLAEADLNSKEAHYEESADNCQKVIEIADKTQNYYLLGDAYNRLADAYKRMGSAHTVNELRTKALEYAQKGLMYNKKGDLIEGQITSYNALGIILRDLKRMPEARKSYATGIQLAKENKFESAIVGILHANTGQAIMEMEKDYDLAIEEFDKAFEIYEKFNRESSKEHVYRNKALAYAGKGDQTNALKFASMAVQKAKDLNSSHRLMNAYRVSKDVQKQFGLYEMAFQSLEQLKVLEDSVSKADKIKAIGEITTKYETVKKEEQIDFLTADNYSKSNQLLIALFGIILLVAFLILLNSQKQKIEKSQLKIKEQSDELKLMMRELHHRVKNNLAIVSSLLNIQSSRLDDKAAKDAIKQGQQRVEAMSLIHQRLYSSDKVASINIKDYIQDLAESLMMAYGYSHDNFDLKIQVEENELDVDLAIPLGLIMNELLTNSFKYAYEDIARPLLLINLAGTDNLELIIKDNGLGIKENSWGKSAKGFGQKLISGLCNQLGGEFSIHNNDGTEFLLKIPIKKLKKAA